MAHVKRAATKALALLVDVALPPRHTERLVRTLTIDLLNELALAHETLPYHEPSVRALVWEIKYRKNKEALALAGEFLAERAAILFEDKLTKPVLVPVPMHPARKKTRGYNQTELLCEAMQRALPGFFSYTHESLIRTRNTPPQQGLPRHRRLKNMLGAISVVDTDAIVGTCCIVIDDVATTGATTHETKRALLEAGAREVYILTLAHS